MADAIRGNQELWQLQVGDALWICDVETDGHEYRVRISRQGEVVAERLFAHPDLAAWWASLERAELLI